jgi:hypothetical protein
MHIWTTTSKAEVLCLRVAGLGWPAIHKRLGLPVSLHALRDAGYRSGVEKRPQYNTRGRRTAP